MFAVAYGRARLFVFVFLFCVGVSAYTEKIQPLQPVTGSLFDANIAEPSGLTFCNSTGHLYAICDKSKCHYIYEVNYKGHILQQYEFDSKLRDIECVACDDVNGVLYIAEEGRHTIHSFALPLDDSDLEQGDEYPILKPISEFYITPGSEDPKSGLEGMTYDTKRNVLYITNEKHPKILYTVRPDGTLIDIAYPDFDSGDLSGICYDTALDLIWYVSDQKERLYVADLTGTIIYDYWDLLMENPEGIAIDNTQDPPMLYIATDPSAPRGPSYVPAIFSFVKPSIGDGLVYYDPENPRPYDPKPCDGCQEVWDLAAYLDKVYDDQKVHKKKMEALAIVLPILGGITFAVLLFGLIAFCYVKKLDESSGYYGDLRTGPSKPWYTRIKLLFTKSSSEDGESFLGGDY